MCNKGSIDLTFVGRFVFPPTQTRQRAHSVKGWVPSQLGLQWRIYVPHVTSHALARRVRRSRGFARAHCRQKQIKEASMSVHVVDTFAAKARSFKPQTRSADQICACPCASCARTGDATLLNAVVMVLCMGMARSFLPLGNAEAPNGQ